MTANSVPHLHTENFTDPRNTPPLADDLLIGAGAIGDFTGWSRRRVFHLAEKGELPVFKVGGLLHARKSTLIRWVQDMEAASMKGGAGTALPGSKK